MDGMSVEQLRSILEQKRQESINLLKELSEVAGSVSRSNPNVIESKINEMKAWQNEISQNYNSFVKKHLLLQQMEKETQNKMTCLEQSFADLNLQNADDELPSPTPGEKRRLEREIGQVKRYIERTTKILAENDIETLKHEIAEMRKSIQKLENDLNNSRKRSKNKKREVSPKYKSKLGEYFARGRRTGATTKEADSTITSGRIEDSDSD